MNIKRILDNDELLVYTWVDDIAVYVKKTQEDVVRLAKIGYAMQWVSVGESLPKHEDHVLITDGYSINTCYFRHGHFDDSGVTHWMPLPSLP